MTQYSIYQRDLITGHMNLIARLECASDQEAARQGRKYAAGKETIICQDRQVIAQFCTRQLAAAGGSQSRSMT